MTAMPHITVATGLQDFLLAAQIDGLHQPTIVWYKSILTPVAARWADRPIDQITTAELRNLIVDWQSATARYQNAPQKPARPGGLSPATILGRIRALRRFFSWCSAEYNLPTNPMKGIRPPKQHKAMPKAIDLDDLRKLMRATGDDLKGARDRAILVFLADTGCRAGGLLGLHPADIDLAHGRAVVHEKGDKTRVVPFTRYTAQLLQAWLAVRPASAETVFCSLKTQSYGQPLTVSGLNQMLRYLKADAGVTGRVNPHSFRHGFARQYLINGGDLATLAQLMGHSSVTVTASFYAVFDQRELQERHARFSPLRGLEGGHHA